MRGLLAGQGSLDPFHLALYYGCWVAYKPFDIGGVVESGIKPLSYNLKPPKPELAYAAARDDIGLMSMSNGAMMRATPLAVWAQNLDVSELE